MSASRPHPTDGFRVTTLLLAATPLIPMIGWQDASGGWTAINLAQAIRVHLQAEGLAGAGALATLIPSVAAGISLVVPTRRAWMRKRLAAAALAIATCGLPLVHIRNTLGPWIGVDALIPADRFVRVAWMTFLLSTMWVYMEWRHQLEEPR